MKEKILSGQDEGERTFDEGGREQAQMNRRMNVEDIRNRRIENHEKQ